LIGLDTSVVVRYLVGTPFAQARRAAALIDGADALGVPLVVLVETAHVLRTQYGVAREDVVNTLIELVTRENLVVLGLPKANTLGALVRARSLPGSPVPDAFIAATARSAGALPLYTFDDDLHRHGVPVATP
jgi:predicted nucleic acid-binding protein